MKRRIHFDGEPRYLQQLRALYTKEPDMNATDLIATLFALGILILAALGLETAYYKVRFAYRAWRVRRLIRREQRQFEDWLETQ